MTLGFGLGLTGAGGGGFVAPDNGSDPTSWSYVTVQWNFNQFQTSDLASGLLDETGNHTLTVDETGYIEDGELKSTAAAGTTFAKIDPCTSNDFNALGDGSGGWVIGGCFVLFNAPSAISENVCLWTYPTGSYYGWIMLNGSTGGAGALLGGGTGGWYTGLQNAGTFSEDGTPLLYSLYGFNDGANKMRVRVENESATEVEKTVTSSYDTEDNAAAIFGLKAGYAYRGVRIVRNHPSDAYAALGSGVDAASAGFPGP